jgi:uncharacterized delta-60 repeat protein
VRISLARIITAIVLASSTVTFAHVGEASATVPPPFDTAFGTNGIAELTLPNSESVTEATSAIEDSSGRLLGLLEVDGARVSVVRLLANGGIDESFGESGRSEFFLLFQASIALQEDGKILVAGYVPNNVLPQIRVLRLTASGVVDTTFGTNGSRTIGGFPGKLMSSTSKLLLRYDPDNSAIYLGFHSPTALPTLNGYNTFTFVSLTRNGQFRFDWARDGSREVIPWTGSNANSSVLLDIQILGDGSLIAVGSSFGADGNMQITLIKLGPSGYLDFTFDGPDGNGNGLVKVDFADKSQVHMSAILPQGDGSFYLAGTAGTLFTGPHHYAMAKFDAAGVPDPSFSSDGFALTQLEPHVEAMPVPTIQQLQNGNLVFPVNVNNISGYTTFTPTGTVPSQVNCTTCLWSPSVDAVRTSGMTVNSAGNVLIVGRNVTTNRFFVTLFTSSGTINHSFQTPDVRFYFVQWSIEAYKAIPQSDTSIIVLASGMSESGMRRGVIFKLTSAGELDEDFGLGGYALLAPINDEENLWLSDIVVQSDGKIVVVGISENNNQEEILLWRTNTDGSADNTFGTGGRVVTSDQNNGDLWSSTLVVQPSGNILLGVDRRENNFTLPWIYRYLPNGTLDTSFTDSNGFLGGIQPTNNEGEGWGTGIYPGPNNTIYLKSTTTINSNEHVMVMRLLANGSPDPSFNSTGRRTWNRTDPDAIDWISDVEVNDAGQVVLLGAESSSSPERSMVIKLNPNGSFDTSFNSTGYSFFLLRDPSTVAYSAAFSMVLSGNNFLVTGGGSVNQSGSQQFSAVAKLDVNGQLDASYGSAGVILNAASDNTVFYDIAKLTSSTSIVTGITGENDIFTGVVMKVSHQMPPTTTTPTLLSPINGSQVDLTPSSFTVTGTFPDTVLSGSIRITLATSDNGGATRSITVSDRQSLNVSFDPLEPDSAIVSNSWASAVSTSIAGATNATARMPDGTYTVSIAYKSANGGPVATATATNVVFRSKCPPGTYSSTSFVPCTATSSGSFQNLYGATAPISCPVGTYQPNSASMFCLSASPGHFVDAPGRSFQTPAPPGRFVPAQGATSAFMCEPGTYQPDTSAITCLDAAVNHFVPVQGSSAQISCPSGTHAPNTRSTSCIALPQNTPTTTIPEVRANAGSDDNANLVISVNQATILRRLQMTVPRGAKVSMVSRTPSVCRVARTRVQATSTGTCRVAVTVTEKNKRTTKTLRLKVS